MKLHYEVFNISANKMAVEGKLKPRKPEKAKGWDWDWDSDWDWEILAYFGGAVKVCLPKQINLEYAT